MTWMSELVLFYILKKRHSNYKVEQLVHWPQKNKNSNLNLQNIALSCKPNNKMYNQIYTSPEIKYPFRCTQLVKAVIISFRIRGLHYSWSFQEVLIAAPDILPLESKRPIHHSKRPIHHSPKTKFIGQKGLCIIQKTKLIITSSKDIIYRNKSRY
jgi:hypothetical protein